MTYQIPPKGRAVLLAWLCLAFALLAPIFFWQGVWWGLLLASCFLFFYLWLWLWVKTFSLEISEKEIVLKSGVFFNSHKKLLKSSVHWQGRYSTPLLRFLGCEIFVFATGGGLLCVCPALLREDIEKIGEL